jgi:hypothetical protein
MKLEYMFVVQIQVDDNLRAKLTEISNARLYKGDASLNSGFVRGLNFHFHVEGHAGAHRDIPSSRQLKKFIN